MPICVALNHVTTYNYDRPISLGPQTVRLRPAPHCRTPVTGYSLRVTPEDHYLNWQQDPYGNYHARLIFREKTEQLSVEVDLVAEMTVINPFEFFVAEAAEKFPFQYEPELVKDLQPFLERDSDTKYLPKYVESLDLSPRKTIDLLVDINQRLQHDISYLIRMQPGVQSCEETLKKRSGSCRDSAWLLVQICRHLGLASRFVSGYLIQLAPDVKSLDGPSGPTEDFTDLHAWTEVYLPGAGWVGLDPTSGLFCGEGHLPLACTPHPQTAAPISGAVDECEVEFDFAMSLTRVREDPRVTKPYDEQTWQQIDQVGQLVDECLQEDDVRLTMGGEPTFVSIDDMEGPEWTTDAVGPDKQQKSIDLIYRLRDRFAPAGLLHFGQGKWYPGESLPRWAYTCMWRTDGEPIWTNHELLADLRTPQVSDAQQAEHFVHELAQRLEVDDQHIRPAIEDVYHILQQERTLPVDVDPSQCELDDPEERQRLAGILERGVTTPTGYVMPLTRAWWQAEASWTSGPWPLRTDRILLIPGDSPLGLRLPFDSLPAAGAGERGNIYSVDTFAGRGPLPGYTEIRHAAQQSIGTVPEVSLAHQYRDGRDHPDEDESSKRHSSMESKSVVATALCVEPRAGRLHVFVPPVGSLEDYLDLIARIEQTAEAQGVPVVIEGYLPPPDHRLQQVKVTPDPGVIEVNVQPAANWKDLTEITTGVYEDARQCRLGTEKFQNDGRHAGTGGGNHIVLGGPSPADSPLLRRPDLLKSLLAYWNNHPSLSYLFSGLFVGPTSQAPRVDEGRGDNLYELQMAMKQISSPCTDAPPWLVDRLFRNLLVDLTGNTHRAEFCIDKLYSPDSATGRLGLLEFRGFEMPPHARMSLAQQLLVRALVSRFWRQPYTQRLIDWGNTLYDRFMLPCYLAEDFRDVIEELNEAGYPVENSWYDTHFEFRFPLVGEADIAGLHLELRQAIEPWHVLGEEPGGGGTTRFVDASLERLQVKVSGLASDRFAVTVGGRMLPLKPTGIQDVKAAGVRFRAWQPPRCLQPTIGVHAPLVFDVVDLWNSRSLGGVTYYVEHPGGVNSSSLPVNALEAESRRAARFMKLGHTPGRIEVTQESPNPLFTHTLDLRTTR
ncbi:transglutaminase family protein [Adhaeretor mobilis]|uniref:Transglutaminase-like superfamily protein n=1 Tax=Adhaeretor mobilis TaxID=1930276 RepID=A0A517MZH2_9BACT|nr:transglutaminase family protein [Adhaeretor mobilis]QDT00273.1 Transglutaminase-like superfamily protein [Adhaeretor mobilis]